MKRANTIFILTVSLIFFLLIMLPTMHAWAELPPPERETETTVLGDIDPYSMTLFGGTSYRTALKTLKLPQGMRLLKDRYLRVQENGNWPYCPDVSSILLGSKVGVMLFNDTDFISRYTMEKPVKKVVIGPLVHTVYGDRLIPYAKIEASTPDIKYYSRIIGSFILYRKDIGSPLGVVLQSGSTWSKFFPLPESPSDSSIIYYMIPSGGPFYLYIVGGSLNHVEVIVQGSQGGIVKLPEPNNPMASFDLEKKGIDQIASIKIIYRGPVDASAYLPSQAKTHRAPPAPDLDIKPPVSVTKDTGTTSGRTIYDIARTFESGGSASQISPSGKGSETTGNLTQQEPGAFGDIMGSREISSSQVIESQPSYPQTRDQRLLPADTAGRQTVIPELPSRKGSEQIIPELPSSRREKVAVSRERKVQQGRMSFVETGQVQPRTASSSTGKAENLVPSLPSRQEREEKTVREKPASERQAKGEPVVPVQKDMMAKITPLIAGQWNSSIGLVYKITQAGNTFQWSVKSICEKGKGAIEGETLSVSWQGQNSSGSAKGKITGIDRGGKAMRIEWSNGVVFFKGNASSQKIEKPDRRAIPINIP